MTNRIGTASYERGIELTAAGCPLDYPDVLPRGLAARRIPFRAQQLGGYAESRVYAVGPRAVYVISLRVGTNVPAGTVITKWEFVPPWQDHCVDWNYLPEDIIPKGDLEAYRDLLGSPLMVVLNGHHMLRRGYPVTGLVCGCACQPIPESCGGAVSAKLILIDDAGYPVALQIRLAVFGSATRSNVQLARAGRRFDRMDERASG